ncbi:hypothetical protein TTHERM_000180999 (macronuclear) [Tetrahymena thermophila SB210]|uniref:Uncharacterized protein n=1 Tax=Tetrahymena thermophila (strain SB210) TaxID=312017 RepID=W7XGP8_TETTS|nr:hypothetical protein TTHERM_000180999 [Tetrahymena thermophila SB210]EWS76213.1 hypothetical protein TTHERM_000180999 [Tetrahymena thermophila SB210]|eukprot:XP_012651260.1 hypothetical protein TTHERM_000180999 [Tetrahymena thermophila SB210]
MLNSKGFEFIKYFKSQLIKLTLLTIFQQVLPEKWHCNKKQNDQKPLLYYLQTTKY